MTTNSHDQWREFKQLKKSMLNLVIKSFFSMMQSLLIELLNEVNVDVQKIHQNVMINQSINWLQWISLFVEFSHENDDFFHQNDDVSASASASVLKMLTSSISFSRFTSRVLRSTTQKVTYEKNNLELDDSDEASTYFDQSSYENEQTSKSKNEANEKNTNDFNLDTIVEILMKTQTTWQIRKIFAKLFVEEQEIYD